MGWGAVRHGPRREDGPAREHRYPRWVYATLSLATILLLLLQVTVGVRQSNRMYPVAAYAMFSGTYDGSFVDYRLQGTRSDGQVQWLRPEELGLTELQLRRNLSVEVVRPTVGDDHDKASARLEDIASIWSDRQGCELLDVTLWRMDLWVDGRDSPLTEVASWGR